ncbi:MAG: EamA family transporter, partial [Chloroflexia bacterium]|nr:EamA family transporter [Chloroflexia bacterium]
MLLVAALWGGNFAALKTLLARLSPADVMLLRVGGASLFFALLLLATGRPLIPLKRADWIRLLLIGLLGVTILNAAMTIGMNMISAALASLIVTSNPIHTALISRLM